MMTDIQMDDAKEITRWLAASHGRECQGNDKTYYARHPEVELGKMAKEDRAWLTSRYNPTGDEIDTLEMIFTCAFKACAEGE